MEGWIKLHRKIEEWEWADDAGTVSLFIHLLLMANPVDGEWHGMPVKRGQLITSVGVLARKTGLTTQQTRTRMERLAKSKNLTIETTSKYTIVTVCNYASYQDIESNNNKRSNKRATNKQQTNNKQITTDREYKNEENEENEENINHEFSVENSLSGDGPTDAEKCFVESENIDYGKLVSYFNEATGGVFGNVMMPISDTRCGMIKARIREHGKRKFAAVIKMAMKSPWLKGQNERGWHMTFDWMIRPTNFEKILSGNYLPNEVTSMSKTERSQMALKQALEELDNEE